MYLSFPNCRLRLHLLALPTLLLLFWVEGLLPAMLLLSSALLHECGHFLALRLTGVPVECVDIEPMGVSIRYRDVGCGWKRASLISFAGAGMNLLCASVGTLCMAFLPGKAPLPLAFFCFCSLFLALLNLLPLEKLDGGILLRTVLSARCMPDHADRICGIVSAVFTVLLSALLLLAGLRSSFPLWTILLSAVFLSRL